MNIDYNEIQKAFEDTDREAFDYFLDKKTGEVIILSEEIINRADEILSNSYDDDIAEFEDVQPDEVPDIPEWMEDEIELALDIFINEHNRYIRIPERSQLDTYAAMKAFSESVEDQSLRFALANALDGQGSFRKFKDALGPHQKERKRWHGFNAKAARKEIEVWLAASCMGSLHD